MRKKPPLARAIQECLPLTGFIWADKAALVMAFLFSLLLLFLWCLAFLVVGALGAKHLWENFGIRGIGLEVLAVALAWFAMRAADFLTGGSTYRLFDHGSALKDAAP